MSLHELYLPDHYFTRKNAKTGRFMKQHVPHNKGKKWGDYMDMRKAKKVLKCLKRSGRADIGGWNKKSVVAVKDGKFQVFESAQKAAKTLNITRRNICQVCNKKRPRAGGYEWYFETDPQWIEKIKQAV